MVRAQRSLLPWAFLVAVILICAAILGYVVVIRNAMRSIPTIVYRLPDGYRGLIEMRLASTDDDPSLVATFREIATNEFEIVIPTSGLVIVDDMSLLRDWHSSRAIEMSGTRLPVAHESESQSPEDVVFHTLHTMSDGTTWFLVGDQRDLDWVYVHTPRIAPGPIPHEADADR